MAVITPGENEPLLGTPNTEVAETWPARLRRTMSIEPLAFMVIVALAIYSFVANLFVYQNVGEAHGFDWMRDSQSDVSSCEKNNSEAFREKMEVIQKEAAQILMTLQVALLLPSIPMSVLVVSLSDKVGRKVTLLAPIFGGCIYLGIFLLVVVLNLSAYVLLIGAVILSLTGGMTTLIQGSFAYLADTVPPENLGFRMVILEMSMGIGAILPVLGVGYWVRSAGFLAPFWLAFGIFVLTLLYVIFIVPETVPQTPGASAFTWQHFREPLQLCFGRENRAGGKLIIPMIIFFVMAFSDASTLGLNQLYTINKPLCWNSVKLGYWTAASIVVMFIGGVGLMKLFRMCGIRERIILVLAVADTAIKFTIVSNATETWIMYTGSAVGILSQISLPLCRSLMSKTVEPSKRGALFGCFSALQATAMLLGNTVIMEVYSSTVGIWPGFAYAGIAAMGIPALVLAIIYSERYQRFLLTRQEDVMVNDIRGSC